MQKTGLNNHDAEVLALASMLSDNTVIIDAVSITAKDFYSPAHSEIFKAITDLYASGTPVDIVTLIGEIERRGALDAIGGREKIMELAAAFYTSANTSHHIHEIKRCAEVRRASFALSEMLKEPGVITASQIRQIAEDMEISGAATSYEDIANSEIYGFVDRLRIPSPTISTGFKILDGITGGIRRKCVFTVGAYASTGKTAFALNVAANQKMHVLFISLEMSPEAIFQRIAATALKIDYGLVQKKKLTDAQFDAIEKHVNDLKGRFYCISDKYFVEQQMDIVANIRPSLVIVDFVQKVRTHRRLESRRTEIEYISGLYKQMASQYDCVVMLLSQLTRPENRAAKNFKPTMAYLKESGALEADGDYVAILHRPYVLSKDDSIKKEDGYILIDKNKYGETGQINLHFKGAYQQFYEVETKNGPKSWSEVSKELKHIKNDDLPF